MGVNRVRKNLANLLFLSHVTRRSHGLAEPCFDSLNFDFMLRRVTKLNFYFRVARRQIAVVSQTRQSRGCGVIKRFSVDLSRVTNTVLVDVRNFAELHGKLSLAILPCFANGTRFQGFERA